MTDVENVLTALVRVGLGDGSVCSDTVKKAQELTPEDWDELVALAGPHHLSGIVMDGVTNCRSFAQNGRELTIPDGAWLRLVGRAAVEEEKYEARQNAVAELADFFSSNGVPFMLLKGWGLSLYYPVPKHRSFSDIDIWNFGEYRRADELVSEKLGIKISNDVHHHTKFVYKGLLVENHYDFVARHARRSDARFDDLLKRVVREESGREVTALGENGVEGRLLLPGPTLNALFLMRHLAAHFAAERVSMRHLCDWKQFVEREGRNVDWTRVNGIYADFRMKRFTDAVTGICVRYLGLDGSIVPDRVHDERLEGRILADVLNPEFPDQTMPEDGFLKTVIWKIRRFSANKWKHRIVYPEPWAWTFVQSSFSHLLKPRTIAH